MFSEQKWNQQYNLGLGYECKFLCNRIVCYRELTTANISSLKQQCDDDQSKSGQQTYVVYPKQKLKNIIKDGNLYTFLGCIRKIRIGQKHNEFHREVSQDFQNLYSRLSPDVQTF